MNSIACTIFFIVGCFGQQNIGPPPPSLDSVAQQAPSGVPNLQPLQAPSGVPNLPPPQVPSGVPNLPPPQVPSGVPNLPPPQVPSGVPNLPPPQVPSGVPNLPPPQVPSGVPNLPPPPSGVPGSSQNGIPNLPVPSSSSGLPMPPNVITNIPSLANGTPGQQPNGIPSLPNGVPGTQAPDVLERPCRPNDLGCIRRYFLQHSKCAPPPGRVPEPLPRAVSNQFYPNVNISETTTNCEYRGFNNARVQEFYINKDTDKLVIAIEMRDLQKSCKDTFFRYHRRGKEPIITHGFASVLFRSVLVTVTIPQVDNLRLDKSDNFAYSNDALPPVVLDPKLGQSSDPIVPLTFAAFVASLPIDVTENLLTEGSYMGATFLQYVICDFGLQVL